MRVFPALFPRQDVGYSVPCGVSRGNLGATQTTGKTTPAVDYLRPDAPQVRVIGALEVRDFRLMGRARLNRRGSRPRSGFALMYRPGPRAPRRSGPPFSVEALQHNVLRCALQEWVSCKGMVILLILVLTLLDSPARYAFLPPPIHYRETVEGNCGDGRPSAAPRVRSGGLSKSAIVGIRGGPETTHQRRSRPRRNFSAAGTKERQGSGNLRMKKTRA